MAEHRVVLGAHVQALLSVSAITASRRLRALESAGLLRKEALFHAYPPHYRIERRGLQLLGSRLPVPKRDLDIRHDVGIAWLWLAARSGTFGSMRTVVSERQMRSRDGNEAHAARVTGTTRREPLGVRLSGQGRAGCARLHYPDLLLVDSDGRRIAVELELSSKGRARRHRILGGYASDRRIDAVLYLVADERIGREVQRAARRFSDGQRVLVQRVRMGAAQLPGAGAMARQASRRVEAAPAATRANSNRPTGRGHEVTT